MDRKVEHAETAMNIEVEAPLWLPRLVNWLAVLVLLSLGVLL